jgi:hypothetical protein
MDMHQNGHQGDRYPPEKSKPDIDISPEIKTERLSCRREKLVDRFRNINGHTWSARMMEIIDACTTICCFISIITELPGVTGILPVRTTRGSGVARKTVVFNGHVPTAFLADA